MNRQGHRFLPDRAMIRKEDVAMTDPSETPPSIAQRQPPAPWGLKRVEHYALNILNSMAAGTNSGLSDGDIDYAIDLAERLAKKLIERGHIQGND